MKSCQFCTWQVFFISHMELVSDLGRIYLVSFRHNKSQETTNSDNQINQTIKNEVNRT